MQGNRSDSSTFRRFVLQRSTFDNRFEPAGAQAAQPSPSIEIPIKPEHNLESLRPQVVQELEDIVGSEYVLTEEADLIAYSNDGTWIERRPNILCNRRDPNEMQRVHVAAAEIFAAAIACGGTLSGEHGIGLLKKEFMEQDLDHDTIEAMKRIKLALDPNNILNPEKIFPTGRSEW